ncbi:MAG: hypothetical protein KF860_14255 [Cyclobacteriaceae bacterium]|nr:hypothetical protein [Cyclobacteriaceae bacterium]
MMAEEDATERYLNFSMFSQHCGEIEFIILFSVIFGYYSIVFKQELEKILRIEHFFYQMANDFIFLADAIFCINIKKYIK